MTQLIKIAIGLQEIEVDLYRLQVVTRGLQRRATKRLLLPLLSRSAGKASWLLPSRATPNPNKQTNKQTSKQTNAGFA